MAEELEKGWDEGALFTQFAVKHYMEEQIGIDAALKAKYDETKIDNCVKYVTDKARKALNGNSGYLPPPNVYHWVREYFLEIMGTDKDTYNKTVSKKETTTEEKPAEKKPEEKPVVKEKLTTEKPKEERLTAEEKALGQQLLFEF